MNAEVVKFSVANEDKMETEWMNFFNNFEWKSGMQYLFNIFICERIPLDFLNLEFMYEKF